jgi:hypothetical protein
LKNFLGVIHEKEPTGGRGCGKCSRDGFGGNGSDVY